MKFDDYVADTKPTVVVRVPPSAWASDYAKRPTTVVRIGFRRVSETDIQTARADSAEFVAKLYTGILTTEEAALAFREAYEDALLRWMVSLTACQPESTEIPYFAGGEGDVRRMLTSDGAKLLWNSLERAKLQDSPIVPLATDADLTVLRDLLSTPDSLHALGDVREQRARRLLAFVLTELQEPEDP